MSRYNLRYQISLFDDFSSLQPHPEIFEQLKSSVLGYQLNRVPFMENLVNESGTLRRNCVKVSTQDGMLFIEFRADRVAFTCLNIDIENIVFPSIAIFKDLVFEAINRVDALRDRSYSRVGYVRYALFDSPSPEIVYGKMNRSIPFQENLIKGDWTNYLPTRFRNNVGNTFNVVTTIKHMNGPMQMRGKLSIFDGIFMSNDINTLAEENGQYHGLLLSGKLRELCEIENKVASQYLTLLESFNHAE